MQTQEYVNALREVIEATAAYHRYDTAGRPWLANALELLHPQTDEHLAGCTSCMYAHDAALPNG